MFIVTLHVALDSLYDAAKPLRVYGPYQTADQAERTKERLQRLAGVISGNCWAQAIEVPRESIAPRDLHEMEQALSFHRI